MRHRGEKARVRPVPGVLAVVLLGAGLAAACASGTQTNDVQGADVTSVAVYPMAGTPDASRASEISFRGAEPDELGRITVVGSKSGRHAGRLAPHSDGLGASFVPAKRFAAGERVRVKAEVPLVGARKGAVSFRIALASRGLRPPKAFPEGAKARVAGTNRFVSRPDLHPPAAKVTVAGASASDDYIFLAPKGGRGQNGPLILDPKGRTIWFHPVRRGFKSYDFRAATYKGKPVLTWWQGASSGEYGGGRGVIADSSYRVIATVRGGNGYPADIHEFRLTPKGTALITAYHAVRWDLRVLHGPRDRALLDSIAMEIDVATGRVLFEWHSLGHIPLEESYSRFNPKTRSPVDYTHLNSVALDEDGNFLISARNTFAVYKVDRRTGRILWRLGGKHSMFKLPKYARFVGQHDFTRAPDGNYVLFDNANIYPPPKWVSRALVFSIDPRTRKARLVHAFRQPQRRGTTTQGGVQVLPDGHYMVGWGGGISDFSEFAADGRLVFDAHLLPKVHSYRAYRFPWSGQPKRPPDVAAVTRKGRTTVYASWNGATDVLSWQVLAGESAGTMSVVTTVPRTSFETAIRLGRAAPHVAVRAVSDSGSVVGTSKTVAPTRG
jgi:hypothetical protein